MKASSGDNDDASKSDLNPLRCWNCNVNFTKKSLLYDHLYKHITQPKVIITRVPLPSLKLTIKNRSEVINSPQHSPPGHIKEYTKSNLANNGEIESSPHEPQGKIQEDTNEQIEEEEEEEEEHQQQQHDEIGKENENLVCTNVLKNLLENEENAKSYLESNNGDVQKCEEEAIPGAEPTPPPDPSPDIPKIRIKTTGLLKGPITITEIIDDDDDDDDKQDDGTNSGTANQDHIDKTIWNDDPLKITENDNILSIFNNNERAKDLGFNTCESEFMPLDRLEERTNNHVQMFNHNATKSNSLNSIAGLPMEALAQQVSRLQPPGNAGMHQQNVLINIQQFQPPPQQALVPPPQQQQPPPPPPPPYQPPPMYHYHQPYQFQPPNPPMYYPPGPVYPQHMHRPPPPQAQMQMAQASQMPPTSQSQMQQGTPYRQPMVPQQVMPRQMPPNQRMPMNQQRHGMGPNRQPMVRPRGPPMVRPRGPPPSIRNMRPRMPMNAPHNRPQPTMKRNLDHIQSLQNKKSRIDILTPDKDDDDCQVICIQPKNTDGGLPQIQSVQGGTHIEPAEGNIMHLSDSITLSVRNPPPRPPSPKKSDAKAVANILATRGITVTATPKAKEKTEMMQKNNAPSPSAPLNLNGAVSIIPSSKPNMKVNGMSSKLDAHLPTVDLTDDHSSTPAKSMAGPPPPPSPKSGPPKSTLPFKCDLCSAQYPSALNLSRHRQNYHKTIGGTCDMGVPLINLKQPGIFQKLSSFGIFNYIPLQTAESDGMFAIPLINTKNPGNVAALGATTMLSLGPARSIPKPNNSYSANNNGAKQMQNRN